MKTYCLFLVNFLSASKHSWIEIGWSISEKILNLWSTYILCWWVNSCVIRLVLTLSFRFDMFSFTEIFLFIKETIILFVVLISSQFFVLIHIFNFFMNTFIRSTQRMSFWLLCWRIIEICSFVNSILVNGSIRSLSHLFCYTGHIFFDIVCRLFSLYEIFSRSERIFQR